MGKMQRLEEDKSKMEESEEIKELRKLKLEKIKFLKDEEDRLNEAKKLIIQSNSKMEYNIDTINLTSQERAKNIQVQRRIIEDQIKKGNFTYDFKLLREIDSKTVALYTLTAFAGAYLDNKKYFPRLEQQPNNG